MTNNFYSWYIAVQVKWTIEMCTIPLPLPCKPDGHVQMCMSGWINRHLVEGKETNHVTSTRNKRGERERERENSNAELLVVCGPKHLQGVTE
jgi:hypothetical protein